MHRIVTGSFVDFAAAARAASALAAAGFVHGEVSIIARRTPPRLLAAAALVAGAAGALVAPGSVLAWVAGAGPLADVAPSFGAAAGAGIGALAGVLADRRSRAHAEEVRVLVDDPLDVARVERLLRANGASLGPRAAWPRLPRSSPRPLRLVPYRP